jgi:hypothetical protein
MSTSTSALKARHYNALANSLRQLQNGLSGSEEQMVRLAEHLGSMQKLGTHSAAQYVLFFPSSLLLSFLSFLPLCDLVFFFSRALSWTRMIADMKVHGCLEIVGQGIGRPGYPT